MLTTTLAAADGLKFVAFFVVSGIQTKKQLLCRRINARFTETSFHYDPFHTLYASHKAKQEDAKVIRAIPLLAIYH